ncbi:MAG: CAP domain-containing protein, partial [Clostridiales bacterium]|nr:CAP domain-containing protein [Clostridiales bacterium]
MIKKAITALVVSTVTFTATLPIFAATEVYTVKRGDSLWYISHKYQVGLPEILEANPQLKDPAIIHPGNRIAIPLVDPTVLAMETEIITLVNKERAKYGLNPLAANWELSRVARYKSNDMRDADYFNHDSPTYGSPFDMMKSFGLAYKSAGENIAKGQKTAAVVMEAWMASDGHRRNILSAEVTEIGVGVSQSD